MLCQLVNIENILVPGKPQSLGEGGGSLAVFAQWKMIFLIPPADSELQSVSQAIIKFCSQVMLRAELGLNLAQDVYSPAVLEASFQIMMCVPAFSLELQYV